MSQTVNLHPRSGIILDSLSPGDRDALLRSGPAVDALAALSLYSPALTQAIGARADLAAWLFLERAFESAAFLDDMASELAGMSGGARTLAEVQAVLRRFRIRELSRLAVRDLTGRAELPEVMRVLSDLAEVCLEKSLDTAAGITAEKFGCEPDRLGFRPVVMGMGKLGGRELNYSSDIDLIYLYQPETDREGAPSVEEASHYFFSLVTRAMSEVTGDGLVFRVDLNLRPGGKDGAQAQAMGRARSHYLTTGKAWERMAMIKARPVAGDKQAGKQFLNDLSPFMFRRHLDYTFIEEIRDLKNRFAREKKAQIRRAVGGRFSAGSSGAQQVTDVKLSSGGIREIEFFAQALTLTFAGRLPHLRQPTTLGALKQLTREGIISDSDAEELSAAYVFLRTAEHRIQLRELTQTQLLPRNAEALENIALSMGFRSSPTQNFKSELYGHMQKVRQRFESLLADSCEASGDSAGQDGQPCPPAWVASLMDCMDDNNAALNLLYEAGFRRPDAALVAVCNIREGRFLPNRLSRYESHLERLIPFMIAGAATTPDPDRAILHLERFLTSIGPKAGFFVLLEENPKLIELLSILFGHSDYLSEILISHPAILDSLIDRRSSLPVKAKPAMVEELETMLGLEDDPESRLTVIRRFKNDETLRIGLYDLLGKLSFTEIQTQLSDLAETVMAETMNVAVDMVLPPGQRQPAPLAVIALGKLGGRELTYGSDLDLIFILDQEKADDIRPEIAIKLAQRFISYLSVYLDAGPGYEIDSRLRPSGGHGPLVVTEDAFARYHETSMLWERQALLKMRWVLGSGRLAGVVMKLAGEAIYSRELPADAAQDIHNLRMRMSRERARLKPGAVNLKFSPGGLVDGEFLTQYLQLIHGREHAGEVRSPSTRTALRAMADLGLGPAGLGGVAEAYDLIGRAANRLSLMYARSGDRAAFKPEEIAAASLPGAGGNPLEELETAMAKVHTVYRDVFGLEE